MFNEMHKNKRCDAVVGALVAALLMLVAGPAVAVPQISSEYGGQLAFIGAEANAMGGTGTAVYRGGLSNVFNPALLAKERGHRFDAGLSLDQQHEDRFQPLFDSFDSWVVDAAIASNRQHFFDTGFGFAASHEVGGRPVTLGLSLADRYPFSYRFEEDLLNPSPFPPGQGEPERDTLIESRERDVTGTLRTMSLGLGSQVHDRVALGLALHYGFGTRSESNTSRDYITTDGDDSYRLEDEFEMTGVNFALGAQFTVNERVEIGVAWESALTADGDRTLTDADPTGSVVVIEEGEVQYPQAFRAGVAFRPRTDPRTLFTIELEYKPWSELEDSRVPGDDNPLLLNDVADVRIGLEHTFYNGMPLRFGFRHLESYADTEGTVSVFSTGVGAPLGGGMLSASVELSKLETVEGHLFPYPTDFFGDNFRADPYARVKDTRFRVGVGYKVEF